MKFDAFCDAATCDLMAESIDKYGEIAVYRLERHGRGSRFGSKFEGAAIKDGLYQSAGIYVFSDLNRMKEYVEDPVNYDSKKPNKGKLCQKIVLDRNGINYPKLQFDVEVMLGIDTGSQPNPFGTLLAEHAIKNIDQLNKEEIVYNGERVVLHPAFGYNGCPGIKFRRTDGGAFSIVFGNCSDPPGERKIIMAEQLIRHLTNIDPSFVDAYDKMMLKYLTNETKAAYKITDPSIIKNVYYFYADALFR